MEQVRLDSVIGEWEVPAKTVIDGSVVIFQWKVASECDSPRKFIELEEVLEGSCQDFSTVREGPEVDITFFLCGLSQPQVMQP